MENEIKVNLYQLKYIYEKDLKNPSLFPEQECLKYPDFLFIHRYVFNSKEYKTEELENTFYNEYKNNSDKVVSNIISTINKNGGIRVGFFTRRNDDKPTYFLLSTYDEDEKYYAKCDEYTEYEELDYMIFYILTSHSSKFGLDSTYTGIDIYGNSENDGDKLKFYEQYFESFDLTNIFKIFKTVSKKDLAKYKTNEIFKHSYSYFELLNIK